MWQHNADRTPRLEKLNETMNTGSFENPSQLNCQFLMSPVPPPSITDVFSLLIYWTSIISRVMENFTFKVKLLEKSLVISSRYWRDKNLATVTEWFYTISIYEHLLYAEDSEKTTFSERQKDTNFKGIRI